MKSKYWKSLPYAIVISALCACITWSVALVFIIAFVCGCVIDEIKIKELEEKTQEEIEEERAFLNKLRVNMTKEQRVSHIHDYLLKQCKNANANVKWNYDAYPEETQEVLAQYGLTYDAEEQKVKRLKRK